MARILIILAVLAAGVGTAYYYVSPKTNKDLPVINPVDLEEEMVDPDLLRVGYGHHIGSFSFTDQNGERVTDAVTDGKIYVAEYFFTTCRSICPIMNSQLQRVQKAFKNDTNVVLLSFTVDPETDDVEHMRRYADLMHADDDKWFFLTGNKKDLYALARKSYFILKPAEAENKHGGDGDFIHTNNFVLVDRQKRIRGYYDGTSKKEVSQLIEDMKQLLQEK